MLFWFSTQIFLDADATPPKSELTFALTDFPVRQLLMKYWHSF